MVVNAVSLYVNDRSMTLLKEVSLNMRKRIEEALARFSSVVPYQKVLTLGQGFQHVVIQPRSGEFERGRKGLDDADRVKAVGCLVGHDSSSFSRVEKVLLAMTNNSQAGRTSYGTVSSSLAALSAVTLIIRGYFPGRLPFFT